MKKLLLGLIAIVMFGFEGNAKQIDNPSERYGQNINPDRITLVLHFTFGRVSRDCRGFGICSIEADIEITRGAFIGGADSNGNLAIDINAEGLKAIRSHFGSDKIVIEENYTIADKTCEILGLKRGYRISPGTYKLILKDKAAGIYSVIF